MRTMVLLTALLSVASARDAQEPVFEVVSIRPAVPEEPWIRVPDAPPRMRLTPGRFRVQMATAKYLVLYAYRVKEWQLAGGPDWIGTERFEINATVMAADNPLLSVADAIPEMLRDVLGDRFQLRVRTEQRRLPAYALVRSRPDGQPGGGLRPSTLDCVAVNRAGFEATQGGARGVAEARSLPDASQCSSWTGPGNVTVKGKGLPNLADALTTYGGLERMVVDRTNLTGTFDFELHWSPIEIGAALPEGPSLFAALQEQLGLELEAREELLDVIVIDHIERPSPN